MRFFLSRLMVVGMVASLGLSLLSAGAIAETAKGTDATKVKGSMYQPLAIKPGQEIVDELSDSDIPTGEGGFARDYYLDLKKGDQVAIDLLSDDFDAMVMLLSMDGSTVGENDDGPDGEKNALLFMRITEDARYIVRVRAFGETGGGKYSLKVTRLKPIE